MATEAVELLLKCMTTLSNGALHERQRTEEIQPWSECEMPSSTEIDPVEAECETASSAEEIEPECELTVPDEAIKPPSKSKLTLSSQQLSAHALECGIILLTKVVESLPECQATFSTEQIELLSEFEKAWSIVSNRALP